MSILDNPAVNNLIYNDQLPVLPVTLDKQSVNDTIIALFIMIIIVLLIAYIMFHHSGK